MTATGSFVRNIASSMYDELHEVIPPHDILAMAREAISLVHQQTFAMDPYVSRKVLPLENNRCVNPEFGTIVGVEGVCDSHGNVEMYLLDSIIRQADGLYTYQWDTGGIAIVPPYTYACGAHLLVDMVIYDTLDDAGAAWIVPYVKKEIYSRDGDASAEALNLSQIYSNEFQRRLSAARKR